MSDINWIDRLIHEYIEGRKALRVKVNKLGSSENDKTDREIINGMINEMSDVIEWLQVGKDPNLINGNDKRSAYQKRVLIDMELFPMLNIEPTYEKELSNEGKELIADILIELSWRERQCYLLRWYNRRSHAEIANELNISRGTVQSYLKRAEKKVKNKMLALQLPYKPTYIVKG